MFTQLGVDDRKSQNAVGTCLGPMTGKCPGVCLAKTGPLFLPVPDHWMPFHVSRRLFDARTPSDTNLLADDLGPHSNDCWQMADPLKSGLFSAGYLHTGHAADKGAALALCV